MWFCLQFDTQCASLVCVLLLFFLAERLRRVIIAYRFPSFFSNLSLWLSDQKTDPLTDLYYSLFYPYSYKIMSLSVWRWNSLWQWRRLYVFSSLPAFSFIPLFRSSLSCHSISLQIKSLRVSFDSIHTLFSCLSWRVCLMFHFLVVLPFLPLPSLSPDPETESFSLFLLFLFVMFKIELEWRDWESTTVWHWNSETDCLERQRGTE